MGLPSAPSAAGNTQSKAALSRHPPSRPMEPIIPCWERCVWRKVCRPPHRDSRLTLHNGQYHLVVTYPAQQQQAETQGRVVALDPGIRSFLTYFSESATGHIGKNDFGRIQRWCAHLDNLLSKAKRARQRFQKRNRYAASNRIRIKIINLVDELHHQAAR